MKRKLLATLFTIIAVMCTSFMFSACTTNLLQGDHTHTFSNEWSYDAEYHWHAATCEHKDQISSRAVHTFNNDICTVCDYQRNGLTEPTEKEYRTVGFVLNGGNGSLEDMQFAVGEIMSALPSPTRKGYIFAGWKTQTGTYYDTTSVMPDTNITLYAQWEKEVDSYEDQYVSFKPATEGTKDAETSYAYPIINKFVYVEMTSDDIGGPSAVGEEGNFDFVSGVNMDYSVKGGYTLQWYYDETFAFLNGAQIFSLDYGSNFQFLTVSDGQRVVQRYLVDFYIKQDYYINLYTNIYASTPYNTVRVIENNTLSPDTPVREVGNYEFDKRVYMNINTGTWTEFNYSTLINSDWALFQTYKPYTLKANLDGGTLDGELELIPYTEKQELVVPHKEGYDFLGWQNPDASSTTTMLFTDMYGYSDLHYIGKTNGNDYNQFNVEELTAAWKPKEYYRINNGDEVTFAETTPKITYINDRNTTISQIDYIYTDGDTQITVDPENLYAVGDKVAARENNGYTLIGWYDEAGVKLSENGSLEFIMPKYKENAVYTMKWQPCAVVLLTNGDHKGSASGLEQITTVVGGEASVTAEAKPLYVFAGWYDEQNNLIGENATYTFIMPEGSVTFTAVFEYMTESDTSDFTFSQNSDSSYTIKSYTGNATSVVIPDTYNGLPVTVIGEKAFYNNTDLLGVDIPESITKIENNAFYNCRALTVINFNAINCTVLSSHNDVFTYAGQTGDGITVNIGATVTKIPAYMFYSSSTSSGSPKIVSVSFAEDSICESIGNSAFYGCSNLTSITIPEGVTSIGSSTFSGCTALTEINFNATNCNDLSSGAFSNVGQDGEGITVNIGADVTKIPAYLFSSSAKIVSINFVKNSVCESIGNSAFYGCSNLTSITIPEGVTSIGNSAFYDCVSLTSIIIPKNVTFIGRSAFEGCTALTEVNFNAMNCNNFSSDNYIFHNAGINGEGVTANIGSNVTKIPNYMFYSYNNYTTYLGKLVSVNFAQNSVCESIGASAFRNCSGLTSITIPDNVTSIGRYAFSGCSGLTDIIIPESATSIGDFTFSGCSSLESITLPFVGGSIKTADDTYQYPFGYIFGTSSFTGGVATQQNYYGSNISSTTYDTYYIPSSLKKVTITGGNILYGAFENCGNLTSITIPESVTSIGERAFYNCSGLTNITIPESVTSIGGSAFYNCSNLANITIPDSVASIGGAAFSGCSALQYNEYENACYLGNEINPYVVIVDVKDTSLTDYTINQNTKFIYDSAFSGCNNMTSITIPNGVTSIGSGAFSRCDSLISIAIPESVTRIGNSAFYGCSSLESITIPDGVTSIGSSAFYYCDSLTSITIPDSVTSIGGSAFERCSSLTSITIPNGVTSIGEDAFYNCSSLTSITIPDSVTSISNYAFSGCDNLTTITIPEGVTSIGYYAFSGCNSLTIYCEVASQPSEWDSDWNYSDCPVVWDCNNNEVADDGYIYVVIDNVRYGLKDGNATVVEQLPSKISGNVVIPSMVEYKTVSYTVTDIVSSAFSGCSSLESITLPFIGGSASATSASSSTLFGYIFGENSYSGGASTVQYYSYSSYITYYIPSSLRSVTITGGNILYGAFYGCHNLTSITIPEGVTSIGSSAFEGCSSLTSITIPEGVTSIGSYAFSGCRSLTSITIPESVTSIGSRAFYDCSSLTSITIPEGVTSIGYHAFFGCSSLTIYCEAASKPSGWDNSWYGNCPVVWDCNNNEVADDGYIYAVIDNLHYGLKDGNATVVRQPSNISGEVMIASTVEYKGITYTVTSIGDYAFYDCSSLTSITIPEGVTSIGYYAFSDCISLTSITIPESVTSIGSSTFDGCRSLTSITIPESVTSIGDDAFYDCSSLEAVYITDLAAWCNISFDGYYANPLYYAHNLYLNDELVTELVIPERVTEIKSYAFRNCSSLKSITIPKSITSIDTYAFYNCTNLENVYYEGTAEDWEEVSIDSLNSALTNATKYYYSETEPVVEGNYWHYVDGVVTVW